MCPCCQIIEHDSNDFARFAIQCCPVMTSSFPRSPCFTLTGSDVIDGIYYVSAVAKLVSLLFGPLLLQWLFFGSARRVVSYVVPVNFDLRKTIYVNKVTVDKDHHQPATDHTQSDDVNTQFARFRQLVKNVPPQQIVDVSCIYFRVLLNYSVAENHLSSADTHIPSCIVT